MNYTCDGNDGNVTKEGLCLVGPLAVSQFYFSALQNLPQSAEQQPSVNYQPGDCGDPLGHSHMSPGCPKSSVRVLAARQ